VTALVGGTAAAQVTMQPIPNPPEKAKPAKHHKSHAKKAEAPKTDDAAAPAAPK